MRLYLSSYQLGNHPEVLSSLVRGSRRGWVVMNALDGFGDERRVEETATQISNLASIGLTAADFDLRDHVPETIATDFGTPDFVWVRGGNVFTLRMAFARSGFDHVLIDGLRADNFLYAGFSAGACVLAPMLTGLELCDSVEDCRATYGDVRYDGLAVLDRPVVPHLNSPGHPESEILAVVAENYTWENQPFWALDDGQVLLVNGSHPRVLV